MQDTVDSSLKEGQVAWLTSRVEMKRKRLFSELQELEQQSWEDIEDAFYKNEQMNTAGKSLLAFLSSSTQRQLVNITE